MASFLLETMSYNLAYLSLNETGSFWSIFIYYSLAMLCFLLRLGSAVNS